MSIKAVIEQLPRKKEEISYPCLRELLDGTIMYYLNSEGDCIVIKTSKSIHNTNILHKRQFAPSYDIEHTREFKDEITLSNITSNEVEDE